MPTRPRRSTVRMTLDEAERIVALDEQNTYDRTDSEVAKIVSEARTVVQRSALWGSGPGQPGRRRSVYLFVASAVFLGVWVLGLLAPLIAGQGN
ncbi:hypothetical protein [Frondihabitans cladoniiphilus]|uniref:DUF3040 family protein n=1 Tax=Frondihabitans cladoniiphilus TaxID=715785 RepID=A0ABP8W0N9_9MICO